MSRRKKKTLQLLALFVVAILAFSSFGSVAAAATTMCVGGSENCNIASYTATSELTDKTDLTQYLANKADSYQQNTQTSADITDSTYSTSLLQSAEWTDKAAGEAAINIHYEADFSEIELRSLYVFTTCTGHGFTMAIAIENIIELLEYNDYVDVIMIGVNNRASGSIYGENGDAVKADAAAAQMFTLRASDFESIEADGLEETNFTSGNYSGSYDDSSKAAIIAKILETHTNEGLTENSYVHELGCDAADDEDNCNSFTLSDYYDGVGNNSDKTYGPYVEVLYSEIEFDSKEGKFTFKRFASDAGTEYTSVVNFVLDFDDQRHAGELFTLYYIAEYIQIIKAKGLDFATTVQAIFNSFDAFSTASRNLDQIFLTDTLYEELAKFISDDPTNDPVNFGREDYEFSRDDLSEECRDALETLAKYTQESRYIVLIPISGSDSDIYAFASSTIENLSEAGKTALKNTLVYTLTVMNPNQLEDNIWDMVKGLIDTEEGRKSLEEGLDSRLQDFNSNIYSYAEDFETTGALNVLYSVSNEATITTTITSEFDVDVGDIRVTNFGGYTTSFDYEVATEEDDDGNTIVTITFSNLTDTANTDTHIQGETDSWGTSWSIDVSIPVQLVDNTEFRTSDDDFKETNVSDTTAFVKRVRTITKDDVDLGTETIAETVTVASPKLYKAFDSSLSIAKTDSAANSEASDTTTETTSTGVLPKAGDSIGALLPIIVAVALGACVVAVVAAFALRKRRRF